MKTTPDEIPTRARDGRVPRQRGALDRYALYELCVTDAARLVPFLRGVHGASARGGRSRRGLVLREDFSGSGALARAWGASGDPAMAVDLDAEALARAAGPGVTTRRLDVRHCRDRADIIAATNFPLGYWHTRGELVGYLRRARASLNPGGVFVADMYGGRHAMDRLRITTSRRGPNGERVEYTWEQRRASPLTGLVEDALHFRVRERGAARARVLRDAFVYHWRLWSLPELREALGEAGLSSVEVYDRLGGAVDQHGRVVVSPVEHDDALDDDWVVYVVGRR